MTDPATALLVLALVLAPLSVVLVVGFLRGYSFSVKAWRGRDVHSWGDDEEPKS